MKRKEIEAGLLACRDRIIRLERSGNMGAFAAGAVFAFFAFWLLLLTAAALKDRDRDTGRLRVEAIERP